MNTIVLVTVIDIDSGTATQHRPPAVISPGG